VGGAREWETWSISGGGPVQVRPAGGGASWIWWSPDASTVTAGAPAGRRRATHVVKWVAERVVLSLWSLKVIDSF
jgi:hypothetical protein